MAVEELSAEEKPRTLPPRDSMADSKERRVRVLGSKNSVARIRPRMASRKSAGWAIISSARLSTAVISSTEKSVMSIR